MAEDLGPGAVDTVEVTIDAIDAIDAIDVETAVRFWTAALGYRRLYERDPYVVLGPVGGIGPQVVVQRVDKRSPTKSAVHLDLRVGDPEATVSLLGGMGASVKQVVEEGNRRWTVMSDPEGTPFCVCQARTEEATSSDGS